MGKTPYTRTKDVLKCKSTFTLKATRELAENKKFSNLPITPGPIKSLFLRFHIHTHIHTFILDLSPTGLFRASAAQRDRSNASEGASAAANDHE